MAKRDVRARTIDGLKFCYKCRHWKEESSFAPRKNTDDKLSTECTRCLNARRLRQYGITQEQYDEMVERQGGVCAICRNPPSRAFDIDHDHACCPGETSCGNCVRGLLCFNCNSAIGKFKEDVETLQRAVTYLTRE